MTELTRKVVESIQAALDAGELGSQAAIGAVAEAFAQIEQSLESQGSYTQAARFAAAAEALRRSN
jgi:hypothetical protein